ncbi:Mlo50p Ecym_1452 [Eremothecium cymbalariae DBVPG|uniref:Uncharacterized protein n=1 Tax=Eremothecium cymbalariae (strain CBS 270.75 / DBVPG 7215 / KCTC 17166 / NRRL Y-17582) TaxID=931890 RepID=G8JMG1_ERECY|nr:hypothetical protein Ecym_1452 [Eremothecium cymbalariae DBVPG\
MPKYNDKFSNSLSSSGIEDMASTAPAIRQPQYIPPHVRLYQARHKVRHKDLATDSGITIDLSDEESKSLLSHSVPFIDDKRNTVFSNCSSIFSLRSPYTTTSEAPDAVSCSKDGVGFVPGDELMLIMEKDISYESMALSMEPDAASSADSLELLHSLDSSLGRMPTLPPRQAQEDAKYRQEIGALKCRIQKSESRKSNQLERERRQIQKRCLYVAEQWQNLMFMDRDVWLIEIRKRNLEWDGIPWQFKNEIYSMCLWSFTSFPSDAVDPAIERLFKAIKLLFFERTQEVAWNLHRGSKWWQGTPLEPRIIEELAAEYPSLFCHLQDTLHLGIWHDFLFKIPLHALANSIINKPRDFPSYEDWLLCLFDGLIISSYYHELDSAWLKITKHILKHNHYKFFGNVQEVMEEVEKVQLDIYGLLNWLRQP